MTKADLVAKTIWDDNGLGKLLLFVPLFGKELPFVLFPADGAPPEVTDKFVATVQDVLALPPGELERVKDLLWEECNFAFQVSWYGVDIQPGETPLQAHLREFEISNPGDAFAQSDVQEVQMFDGFEGRFAKIQVNTGSGSRISIVIRNGQIVDFDSDGTFLGAFDEDERHAHKKRQKVLDAD